MYMLASVINEMYIEMWILKIVLNNISSNTDYEREHMFSFMLVSVKKAGE